MFLRSKNRFKDGKQHRYWSIVENRRVADGRVVQRQVLYLGEINDSQKAAWCKAIEVLDEDAGASAQVALFPEDRTAPALDCDLVQVRLSRLRLHRPRQWGACWLTCALWDQLCLDDFWLPHLLPSRKGTRWLNVLKTLVAYRLIDPGSEWRLHRDWFDRSAMGDLLGEDFAIAHSQTLYRCLDKLLAHKKPLFFYLQERWRMLFDVRFDVLLYDLTSTYFESEPPEHGKRKYGYSRDKRPDCVQVVIALIVPRTGFRWPTRSCRATPATRPRWKISWPRSSSSTARPSGSGSWIAESPPRTASLPCVAPTHRCATSSGHPRGA